MNAMFSAAYKRYALAGMTAVFGLNFLDRDLMTVVLQPIKVEMHLSDTQLGFLTGIAYGFLYATLGLPFARWADRGNRVTIMSVAIGLWGITVMAYLFLTNFTQLVFARIAAAIGDSGCRTPTYSLIGDYFPGPGERTRAMGIYMTGGPLTALLSFILGGWLNELYGWRITFFLMGIPGVILAVIVKLTIVEPRTKAAKPDLHVQPSSPMGVVLRVLWHNRSLRHLSIAVILVYTLGLGLGPWYGAFLIRSHGMGTGELGVWLGLIFGAGGVAGSLGGGYLLGSWCTDDDRQQMRICALTVAAIVPCLAAFLMLPEKHLALIALIPQMLGTFIFLPPTYALMQRLVVDKMRATTMAVVMLMANLIGMGLGSQAVGLISDLLMHAAGINSLRYAMLIMSVLALWAGCHLWLAGQTIEEDLAAVPRT